MRFNTSTSFALALAAGALVMVGTGRFCEADVFGFVAQQNGNFDKLNITTGGVTIIKNSGSSYWGLAYNSGETVLYGITGPSLASSKTLVTINQNDGSAATVGTTGAALTTITNLSDGRLFGIDSVDSLYQINPITGAATLVGPTGLPSIASGPFSNSLASDGATLYYTLETSAVTSSLYSINFSSGAATLIGPTQTTGIVGSAFAGLTFDSGQLYGFRSNGQTVIINTTTGAATLLNTNGITDIFGGVGVITVVPEPASLSILLVTGVPLLAGRRRILRK